MTDIMTNLAPLISELYLAVAACLVLLFCVITLPRITWFLILTVLGVLALTAFKLPDARQGAVLAMNGMFIADGFALFVKVLLLLSAMLSLLISWRWLLEQGGRAFEFLVLMMFALVGMMCMVSAHNLLALYMGLELSSLALYVLASFDRDSPRASEAGLKYFVLGALASGMMLFGISLIYGFTGTLGFDHLAVYLSPFAEAGTDTPGLPRVVVLGVVLLLVGLCFKVSAVPFHMWTPDVYEGAPTPVTAFFSLAPKIAAFALFARVLMQPFADLFSAWQQIIVFVSFASMLVGALAALRQTNLKRLLAYSSIGHAGFVLMGLAAGTSSGVQGMLMYLVFYVFMSAGAFGCVLMMRREGTYLETISDLSGLSKTHPGMALALAVFMFSMAGIPPLAGFFGKMYVILPAIEAGLMPLAVVGLLVSVISCYYYLRVIKFMYFDEPHAAAFDASPFALRFGVSFSAVVTGFYFLLPTPLVAHAKLAAALLLR